MKNFTDNYSHIQLAHGNGGRYMRELINELFARYLKNPFLDTQLDASAVPIPENKILMMTTDGFTVNPLEFPGGDIGSLAIHGTVNDLSVSGAIPLYLTLNAFIEEGLEVNLLERLIKSLSQAAKKANVHIVAGDTKVVNRGEGGGIYFATTGIGVKDPLLNLGIDQIQSGDKILLSGSVGDHGTAVMLAREQFGLSGNVISDSANVIDLTQALLDLSGLKFMRDPTRGGLATVMHEICIATKQGIRLYEEQIPIKESVQSVCDILGYDPLFLACEGRVVAFVSPDDAEQALERWLTLGHQAAVVGEVTADLKGRLILQTNLGGERYIEQLEDDPLPRIC
jgi:hydrogenase expression/formation protein HypE